MTKILLVLSYFTMIAINALANIIPISGENTGAISDSYPNLFAPAGYTFSIWGVIYILLGLMLIFLVRNQKEKWNEFKWRSISISKISNLFIISSFANAIWILTWHYRMIGLSVVIMKVILITLIIIMKELIDNQPSKNEKLWLKIPTGVYLGWITVATVANITTFLVSINWTRFGLSEQLWMIIILVVATIISIMTLLWTKCAAYGMVIIWAYIGILNKHTSYNGFNNEYNYVVITVYVMIAIVIIFTGIALKLKPKS